MVRHLRRNSDSPAYAKIIALFQDLVERHVPVGPGDRFVHPVAHRHLHSVRSAVVEYGLTRKRVRSILEHRALIGRSDLSDTQVYVGVADADMALSGLAENLTTVAVGEILGVHEDRVRDLVQRNLLEAAERGTADGRPFHRFDKAAIDGSGADYSAE